ncbi:MAG: SIS domain-containing protein [Bacilli bacterium]
MQEQFSKKIRDLLDDIDKYEKKNILSAAAIIYDAMKQGKVFHVFATGHSHMVGEEMLYRAGGLVQINPILVPELMQHKGAVTSTKLERVSGIAFKIYNETDIRKDEPIMIVSNSGINPVPIEMAELASSNGHPVIVMTSMEMSKKVESRMLNKKHLYDFGDVVIDNHTPSGDGVIMTSYGQTGASSSVTSLYIVQKIILKVIELYINDGLVPPIYMSANIEGGDLHNKALYEQYSKRIKPLN